MLISTIGIFAIGFANHESHTTCPISIGSDCSYMNNAFAMLDHHISGVQTLTEATTTSSIGIVLIILSALVISWLIKPKDFIANLVTNFRYIYIRYTAHPVFLRILRWIALRNKLDIYSYAKASSDFKS